MVVILFFFSRLFSKVTESYWQLILSNHFYCSIYLTLDHTHWWNNFVHFLACAYDKAIAHAKKTKTFPSGNECENIAISGNLSLFIHTFSYNLYRNRKDILRRGVNSTFAKQIMPQNSGNVDAHFIAEGLRCIVFRNWHATGAYHATTPVFSRSDKCNARGTIKGWLF